jgi:hypothetical protein
VQQSQQHAFMIKKEQNMPNTSKSSKKTTPPAVTAASAVFETFTPVYVQSVERVAELQKTYLDAAAEQTSEWFTACKKTMGIFPLPGPAFFFDFAGQAFQTWIETQKSAIDLVVEQNQAVVEITKERAETYSKITEGLTVAFQSTVAQSVEAQKKVLDFAGGQTKAIFAVAKKVAGPAAGIVDTFEGGVNTVIETQKSFLQATTKPFVG